MRKKFLCIVLAIIICNFCLFTYAENTMSDLQTEHQEVQNQLNNANSELTEVQEELSANLQQVQKLDEKIQNSEAELEQTNKKINQLNSSVQEIEGMLKIAKENYEKQKGMLEERLVLIYESGDTQYLDVILSSRNISDFLSNYFLVTELATYDTEILEDMKTRKTEIELTQEKLDKQKKELADIKKNQLVTSTVLQNTQTLRQSYVSKLSEQEKDVQAKIDEYTQRFEQINAEILALAQTEGISAQYIGGELAWPVPGYTRITSQYGMRTHPITGVYKLHTGVDVGAPMGANFVAANDGIVVKAGFNSAYGNMVIIDHGGGISTLYAHGSEIVASVGQTVKRGDVILKVGSTGYSTGAHAHFEVRINGVTTNPMPYITSGVIPGTEEKNTDENSNNINEITNNTTIEN